MIDFSPLWKTMEERGVSQYRFPQSGIDNKTLDLLKKNKNITLLTLEKLRRILSCTPKNSMCFQDYENSFGLGPHQNPISQKISVFLPKPLDILRLIHYNKERPAAMGQTWRYSSAG